MSNPRNPENSGIRTVGEDYRPYVYPGSVVPVFSDSVLAQTEAWASRVTPAAERLHIFSQHQDRGSTRLYLSWLTQMTIAETEQISQILEPNRPVDTLPQGSWRVQTNSGMLTCQIASAANGLNFLYPNNPNPFTEAGVISTLEGQDFVRSHPYGAETGEIGTVLPTLAPHIRIRRTTSVTEMIRASMNGAAVIFPISSDHEGLIAPGYHLQRGRNGIELQIVDPMYDRPRFIPIEEVIRSEVTVIEEATLRENNVLIMERMIQTITDNSEPISTTVPRPLATQPSRIITITQPIRTIPSIRTVETPVPKIRTLE